MFLDNRYSKIYHAIITKAKFRTLDGYSERHHIIPKSLGGSNDPTNIVSLTAREHFVCHRLLTKMVSGQDVHKMVFAAWQQSRSAKYHDVRITSRTYETLRRQLSESYKGRKRAPFSEQARANMREAAKHRKKVIYTEERLSKLRTVSEVRRGKKLTDEHRQKCSASLKGKVTSDETKDKIRLRKIGIKRPLEVIAKMKDTISERYPDGRPNGMTGRRHTESSLTKMRMSKFGASNARRMRPIICINTDEVFSSVKAASEKLNIPSSYISAVLTGIQKSTNGFEFRYVNG